MVRLASIDLVGELGRVPEASPRLPLAIVAIATAFALALAGPAAAKPLIGKDGKIHACYRVKGKPRGGLRVVKSAKARCRRGERKVAWVAGGAIGEAGAPGAVGHPGAQGSGGSSSTLEEKVVALTARVKDLEAILQGVTNSQLLAAINSVPVVETLCDQTEALTEQTGALGEAIEGLSLNALLLGLGGALNIPGLPEALPDFSCT